MNTFINQLTEEVLNEAFDIKSIANAFFAKHPGLLKQVKNMCGSFKPDIKLNKADYNVIKEIYINNDVDKAKQLIKGLYKPQDKKYSYLMSMMSVNEAVSKKLLGIAFMLALSSGLLAGCSMPTGYEDDYSTEYQQPEEEVLTLEKEIKMIEEIVNYQAENTSFYFDLDGEPRGYSRMILVNEYSGENHSGLNIINNNWISKVETTKVEYDQDGNKIDEYTSVVALGTDPGEKIFITYMRDSRTSGLSTANKYTEYVYTVLKEVKVYYDYDILINNRYQDPSDEANLQARKVFVYTESKNRGDYGEVIFDREIKSY